MMCFLTSGMLASIRIVSGHFVNLFGGWSVKADIAMGIGELGRFGKSCWLQINIKGEKVLHVHMCTSCETLKGFWKIYYLHTTYTG